MHYQMLDKNILQNKDGLEFNAFFINEFEEYYSCSINLNNMRITCFKDTQENGFVQVACPAAMKMILKSHALELMPKLKSILVI